MLHRLLTAIFFLALFLSACAGEALSPTPDELKEVPAATLRPTKTAKPSSTPEFSPTPDPTNTPEPNPTPTSTPISLGPFYPVELSEDLPQDLSAILYISPEGKLWLETGEGILTLQDDTWEVYLPNIPGELVGVDHTGRVWVIDETGSSISSWDGSSWTVYSEEDGWEPLKEYSYVRSRPATDHLGQVWLVTDSDLRLFDGQSWSLFTPEDLGVAHPLDTQNESLVLNPKYIESNNELWLGTCLWTGAGPIGGQGVLRYDGRSWRKIDAQISSGCTKAIQEDNDGKIWIGLDGDLWRYDPSTGELTLFESPASPFEGSSFFNGVGEITLDAGNNPWAEFLLCGGGGCGFGMILYRHDDGSWVQIVAEELQGYRKLVFDGSGTPWLLTFAGIYRVKDNELEHTAALKIMINSGTQDSQGRVWFIVEDDDYNELWTTAIETPAPEPSITPTLSPVAECPPPGEAISIKVDDLLELEFEKKIAAYLNARGSADGLQSMLTNLKYAMLDENNPEQVKAEVITVDVTGDGIGEVLVSITIPYGNGIGETTLSSYMCKRGEYVPQVLFARRGAGSAAEGIYTGGGAEIFKIRDMNMNGIPEVIFSVNWPNYSEFYIAEWQEEQFESLVPRYLGSSFEWISRIPISSDTDLFQIKENSGDNLIDFVITRPHECSAFAGCLPLRTRTETWSWNGEAYYPNQIEYSQATYRFQAAVDGDNATRAGDYEAALAFYQQAIFDEQLEDDWPDDNPLDRNIIEAYARYRILLLRIIQGHLEAAETVFENLLMKFPEGTVGYDYAALATVFWDEYLRDDNFESACKSTKEHALANGVRLDAPYSDGFYEIEDFSNFFPQDICSYSLQDYQ